MEKMCGYCGISVKNQGMETLSKEAMDRLQRQFVNLCVKALKNERIDYYRHQNLWAKKEKSICELTETELTQLSYEDEYDLGFRHYLIRECDVVIYDSLLAEALDALNDKKRNVVLFSYYMGMSDSEIAKEMHLHKSTIQQHRVSSLKKLKKYMEEKTHEET